MEGEEEYQSLYQSLITIDDRNQSILSLSLSLFLLTPPLSHTSLQFLHSIGSDNDNRGKIEKGDGLTEKEDESMYYYDTIRSTMRTMRERERERLHHEQEREGMESTRGREGKDLRMKHHYMLNERWNGCVS